MSDNGNDAALPHGDYPMPDGRVHHVLEVQDGVIDLWSYLKTKLDPLIEKRIQEIANVNN